MSASLLCALACLSPCAAPPITEVTCASGRRTVALVFTPDGKRLVSLGAEGLRVWDAFSGKELHRLKKSGLSASPHLSADNESARWIRSHRAVYQWKYGEREPEKLTWPRSRPGRYSAAAVSPDGRLLAAVTPTDRRFRLVSLLDDQRERVLANLRSGYENSVHFSPDGRLVALVSGTEHSVSVFDTARGELVRKIAAADSLLEGPPLIAWSPDSRSLARHHHRTSLIELGTAGERQRLPLDERGFGLSALAWSADGRFVARGYRNGHVAVFDSYTCKQVWQKDAGSESITALAFSRHGRKLAANSDRSIHIWSLPAPRKVISLLSEKEAWRDLAESDAGNGFKAIVHFISEPDAAVKWFAERLKPRPEADAKRIAQLIDKLDDEDFEVRQSASEELATIGPPARAPILETLKNPRSLEVKRRCEALLRKLGTGSLEPDRLRAARSIESLERMNTPAAREVLKKLLGQKLSPEWKALVESTLARMGER